MKSWRSIARKIKVCPNQVKIQPTAGRVLSPTRAITRSRASDGGGGGAVIIIVGVVVVAAVDVVVAVADRRGRHCSRRRRKLHQFNRIVARDTLIARSSGDNKRLPSPSRRRKIRILQITGRVLTDIRPLEFLSFTRVA